MQELNTQAAQWHGFSPSPGQHACTCPPTACGGAVVIRTEPCRFHDMHPWAQFAHAAADCPGPPVPSPGRRKARRMWTMAYLRNLLTRRAKPAPTGEPSDNQPNDGEGSCESFMWEHGDLWRCRNCDTVNSTEEDQRCQACDTPAPSQR